MEEDNRFSRLLLRRSTSKKLKIENPLLRAGEPLFEIDTNELKIGDGIHRYKDLPYVIVNTFVPGPSPDEPEEGYLLTDMYDRLIVDINDNYIIVDG